MRRIVHHKKFQIFHQTRFCSNQFYISTKPANLFQKNPSSPPTFSCFIDMTYLQQSIVIILLSLIPHSIHAIRLLSDNNRLSEYNRVSQYLNREECLKEHNPHSLSVCDPSLVHIAMTLDFRYLRGSMAAIHSVLKHTSCPENVYFHFIASGGSSSELGNIVESTFPRLGFKVYPFDERHVKDLISSSIRQALEEPLNYARIYLAEIIQPCVDRVIYLDSDTMLIDDIEKLWGVDLSGGRVIGAPEYCHAKFSAYFTEQFWSDSVLSRVFKGKKPCYFNTGVMVMDLGRWREGEYTNKIEKWMRIQKETRIYQLGSLPPFLLVFGGEIEALDHMWNQHGLGGDNMVNSCRSLHPGPVSLLHWSGKEKPWVRLDLGRPCPVDHLWAPYDLYRTRGFPKQYHKG